METFFVRYGSVDAPGAFIQTQEMTFDVDLLLSLTDKLWCHLFPLILFTFLLSQHNLKFYNLKLKG